MPAQHTDPTSSGLRASEAMHAKPREIPGDSGGSEPSSSATRKERDDSHVPENAPYRMLITTKEAPL
jgi:hypothetical protein